MGIFNSLWNLLGKPKTEPEHRYSPPPDAERDEEVHVPEVSPADLKSQRESANCPLLLDVREQYEWKQVRIPASTERPVLHIPMNEVPNRLGELPKDKEIVVFCAHGSRSYGVTAWLNEQGYDARNLAGGITQWTIQGGEVQTGKARGGESSVGAGGGAGGWE